MADTRYHPWLNRFAVFTAASTLVLIGLGGLVTSREAGMAVPDWPTSYGYNMFAFPISKWVGGIFYEHTHRLVATFVGMLVVALTRWAGGRAACRPLLLIGSLELLAGFGLLYMYPALKGAGYFLSGIGGVVLLAGMVPFRNKPAELPVRQLAWAAFVLVQVQGLLGGLRVVLIWDKLGVFHAALAQVFFVVLCVIAFQTSRGWLEFKKFAQVPDDRRLRKWLPAVTLLIFFQLIVGATMRHEHAGLAIPDFPLAYHKVWPAMDAVSIESYNQLRVGVNDPNPITTFAIGLQLAHRFVALLIFLGVSYCVWASRRLMGAAHPLAKFNLGWLGLIFLQIALGAFTIWSNKAADIATAHVVTGALSLMFGVLLTIQAFRVLIPKAETLTDTLAVDAMTHGQVSAK